MNNMRHAKSVKRLAQGGVALLLICTSVTGCNRGDSNRTEVKEKPSTIGRVVLMQSQDDHGNLVSYVVSSNEFQETVSWDGENGGPPLPVDKAISIAAKYLSQKHPDRKHFRTTYIALQRAWLAGVDEYYWFYFLQLCPGEYYNLAADPQLSESYMVVVLMNGAVVEPSQTK